MTTERDWDVLLLGGNGGSGKTTLALGLARALGVEVLQVDDLRLALQQYGHNDPSLRFFLDEKVWELPVEQLRDGLVAIAQLLEPAIEVVVRHHLATRVPVILEGDGISPSLMKKMEQEFPGRVRSVMVVETDAVLIADRMRTRGRGFGEVPPTRQRAQVLTDQLYGQWLTDHARRLGIPVGSAEKSATRLR